MFIIGKNFMKGTVVVFEEVKDDHVVWSSEADIDLDFFQAVSLYRFFILKYMYRLVYLNICQIYVYMYIGYNTVWSECECI